MRRLRVLYGVISVLLVAAPACRAASLKIIYAFKGGTDGTNPLAGVIAQDGALFGTTEGGGNSGCAGFGCGTVFRLDVARGTEKVLYRFADSPDAALPSGSLLRRGHVLYGSTIGGGTMAPGMGAVFAVDDRSGSETVVDSLGGAVGHQANGGLTDVAGAFFGTAELGGSGAGTVFQVRPSGGLHAVYDFRGGPNDGEGPYGNLATHAGVLFGTTLVGGQTGDGTVFQLDPKTGREKLLHSFQGGDGVEPISVTYDNGRLYGVTAGGGNPSCNNGCGTIFRIDLNTGAFSTLYDFNGGTADGYAGDSIVVLNGSLYGTTGAGGKPRELCEYGCGTLFQYDLATKTEHVRRFFFGLKSGLFPNSVIVSNGVLYGTTQSGGDVACEGGSGCGVVFAYTP